ncbi:hypothetical protein D3C76_334200 [compost metagenome]
MAFTFPIDSNNKAGAVRATANNSNFYVPVVVFAPDGTTPVTSSEGVMLIRSVGSSIFEHGVYTAAAANTKTALISLTCNEVTLFASDSNIGYVLVGNSNLTPDYYGYKLYAGDSVTLPVRNLSMINLMANTIGDGVRYVAH